jgi:hypothetical protein
MRTLLKLGLIAGIVAGIAKLIAVKNEWSGLTEPEVRAKLDAKLAGRVEDETKRREIGDKVITGMRDKGLLRETDTAEGNGSVAAATGDTSADG